MFASIFILSTAFSSLAAVSAADPVGKTLTLRLPEDATNLDDWCVYVWGPDCTNTVPDPTQIGYVSLVPDSDFCDIDKEALTFDARCYFLQGDGIYEHIDAVVDRFKFEIVA